LNYIPGMYARLAMAIVWACLAMPVVAQAGTLILDPKPISAHEGRIRVGTAELYSRDIGAGRAVLVLHGGPDFDHLYLLPELDRLADAYHLIYYDQRGRGQSASGVRAADVTLASDVDDLDAVRKHFHLDAMILLGHSWGTVLALEYALRHPEHVSQLILMNPAPASTADLKQFREIYIQKLGPDYERQRQIMATPAYRAGDPETVAMRYRLHFKPALARTGDYEKLMGRMKAAFIRQGKDGIVKARAVEDRLMLDTWGKADYDLLPKLNAVQARALVISGDHDFFPETIAEHIAHAAPHSELVMLTGCGHFAYLECAAEVRENIDRFLNSR
jgi:proline iminopeptidase